MRKDFPFPAIEDEEMGGQAFFQHEKEDFYKK